MSTKAEKILSEEIRAGAWVTPGGDPVTTISHTNEGPCGYCGETVNGYTATTAGGFKLAMPGTSVAYRWETVLVEFDEEAEEGRRLRFEQRFVPWHVDCMDWLFDWTMNANGTVHIAGCRHAQADPKNERVYHGTRGEARHMLNDRFCGKCAPLQKWLDAA